MAVIRGPYRRPAPWVEHLLCLLLGLALGLGLRAGCSQPATATITAPRRKGPGRRDRRRRRHRQMRIELRLEVPSGERSWRRLAQDQRVAITCLRREVEVLTARAERSEEGFREMCEILNDHFDAMGPA